MIPRRSWCLVSVVLLLVVCVGSPRASIVEPVNTSAVPVLVELFTAEGCSSCPPADMLFDKMIQVQPAAGAEVVGLGEHVDYWNQLGWKDRFSSAALTTRQRQYAARAGTDNIYTPEMVIDGGGGFVGTDVAAARRAIENSITAPHGVIRLTLDPQSRDKITVTVEISRLPVATDDTADLIAAVTEDGLRTDVKRGENQGRTLTHVAVVRDMVTVAPMTAAEWSGRATMGLSADWRRDHLKVVAFVQQRGSRHVLATAAIPLEATATVPRV